MILLATVLLTSLLAGALAVIRLRLSASGLTRALAGLADVVGTGVVFAAFNLATGAAAVFALRVLTGHFVSLYSLDDLMLIVLSLLQGCLWRLWRDASRTGAA
jgi:hypothetical protein